MFRYDSSQRITAAMCLKHDFFKGLKAVEETPVLKIKLSNIVQPKKLGSIGSLVMSSNNQQLSVNEN